MINILNCPVYLKVFLIYIVFLPTIIVIAKNSVVIYWVRFCLILFFFQHRKTKTNKICKGMLVNILKSIYFFLRYYLDMLVDYLFSLYWDEHRKPIPDLEDRHYNLMLSAVSLAEKIRKKELKSFDLVTACIERIKQVSRLSYIKQSKLLTIIMSLKK